MIEKIEEKVIKNLDKQWFSIINSIKYMNCEDAKNSLEELYDKIPLIFGFPKTIMKHNEYKDLVPTINPDWIDARNWINYHAGWVINIKKSENRAFKHPIRILQEKFILNSDYWSN